MNQIKRKIANFLNIPGQMEKLFFSLPGKMLIFIFELVELEKLNFYFRGIARLENNFLKTSYYQRNLNFLKSQEVEPENLISLPSARIETAKFNKLPVIAIGYVNFNIIPENSSVDTGNLNF